MRRYHVCQQPRATKLSVPETQALRTGVGLIFAAVVAAVAEEQAGGLARFLGSVALGVFLLAATSRGVALYRAGATASLPAAVGKVRVRIRPARGFGVSAVGVALVLPLAAAAILLAVVEWAWLPVSAVVLVGCAAAFVTRASAITGDLWYALSAPAAEDLLSRLCMRADMPVPELVVEHDVVANAWTARGRIHLTSELLERLDARELEAVLAHEVAHLARRDAAVMEICSAPSRILLGCARQGPRLARLTRELIRAGAPIQLIGPLWLLAVLCIPPAAVVGWMSRLSVLGLSRARELSADAAAVALTGNPSALASALMKLDVESEWLPRADLRQTGAHAVLCIVGTGSSRLGRWFSTHPPTALRVKRLTEIESRIQAGPHA
jgi:heat shock protein HtpX